MAPSATTNGYGGTMPVNSSAGATHIWLNNPLPDDLKIREQPLGTRKKLRVVLLGAGISGLAFFKWAEEKLTDVEICCYEKNNDIGGTWLENRYPGCACDVPSCVYQWPWRPSKPSKYSSSSREIWEYLKEFENENSFIEKYVKVRHRVQRLSWSSETAQWTVTVEKLDTGDVFEDYCHVFINGGGPLNKWKWPTINGLDTFGGTLMHTAQYDESLDLKGKRVALIGAGSSGVQLLPNIYSDASHIYHWVRSRIWVTPGFASAFAGKDGANFIYSEEQRKLFEDRDAYKAYCKMIESEINKKFSFILNGSKEQKDARAYYEREMQRVLKDRPDLVDIIMPTKFFVGCRRPTPGNGYLEALSGSKTTVFSGKLPRITKTGFIDSEGQEHQVDVIICATGFDTTYTPSFPLIVDGIDKREEWKSTVPSYLSLAYAGVPNFFISGGAYNPTAHGSFFPLIDAYVHYFIQMIDKMQVEGIRSVTPKSNMTEQFLRHANSFLKRTAWTGPCSSVFKGGSPYGNPAIYPGSRIHFLKMLERPRYEDFEIEYDDNDDIWSFMGDGFHICEKDGSDITWYLGVPEQPVDELEVKRLMSGLNGIPVQKIPGLSCTLRQA